MNSCYNDKFCPEKWGGPSRPSRPASDGPVMSLPTMSLGLRFCMSRKGGTGGGHLVHPKGANNMATSGLVFRSDLVGTGRAISILFGIDGVRNKQSHLVKPPFPEFKAHSFSYCSGHSTYLLS